MNGVSAYTAQSPGGHEKSCSPQARVMRIQYKEAQDETARCEEIVWRMWGSPIRRDRSAVYLVTEESGKPRHLNGARSFGAAFESTP